MNCKIFDNSGSYKFAVQLMETVLTNADELASTSNNVSFDGANWVESFVNEMIKATSVDDARPRVAKILVAFEEHVSTRLMVSEEVIKILSQLDCHFEVYCFILPSL